MWYIYFMTSICKLKNNKNIELAWPKNGKSLNVHFVSIEFNCLGVWKFRQELNWFHIFVSENDYLSTSEFTHELNWLKMLSVCYLLTFVWTFNFKQFQIFRLILFVRTQRIWWQHSEKGAKMWWRWKRLQTFVFVSQRTSSCCTRSER